jgi:hypothetical protein
MNCSKFNCSIFVNLNKLGIFAPLKTKVVNIRIKITKKQLLKLVIFTALIGFAFILDNYLEKNPVEITGNIAQKGQNTEEHFSVYIVSQITSYSAKISAQKIPDRKYFQQSHDKLIQKFHQLRNYQLLKSDAENLKEPLLLTFHFLVFRNYFYSSPDDVPLIS